jgi:hypothetical protein
VSLHPLTVKVIDDLGASMQAAAVRLEAQAARLGSLEETIAALGARLEAARVAHDKERAVLEACRALPETTTRWYQNSGPFRHVCRAVIEWRRP